MFNITIDHYQSQRYSIRMSLAFQSDKLSRSVRYFAFR